MIVCVILVTMCDQVGSTGAGLEVTGRTVENINFTIIITIIIITIFTIIIFNNTITNQLDLTRSNELNQIQTDNSSFI